MEQLIGVIAISYMWENEDCTHSYASHCLRRNRKIYHSTITSLIDDSLNNLWPDTDTFCEKFASCISDVALYIVKAVTPILS